MFRVQAPGSRVSRVQVLQIRIYDLGCRIHRLEFRHQASLFVSKV